MKTVHLFEDAIYHIGNKAVAKCFMFKDQADCQRFKANVDKHLGPLCDVIAFGLGHDDFHLLIRLKSRKEFEQYYKLKYSKRMEVDNFIPESTYIFAQAMANMQSGYVKYFNHKYERDGGLMKSRYSRILIENDEQMEATKALIHGLRMETERKSIWTFRRKGDGFRFDYDLDERERSSRWCYEQGGVEASFLRCLKLKSEFDMRGQFDNLPPKRLEFKNNQAKFRNLVSFLMMKV